MSNKNNSLQRTLFNQRSMRRKLYKKIQNKLLEMGIQKEDIEGLVSSLQTGLFTLGDSELTKDVQELARLDKYIEKLEKKCANKANETPESEGGLAF